MGFEDLATVVDGNGTDDIDMKLFTRCVTRDKILGSWAKVGFVPFTRNCLCEEQKGASGIGST
jgi:hypothetical protein